MVKTVNFMLYIFNHNFLKKSHSPVKFPDEGHVGLETEKSPTISYDRKKKSENANH